MKKILLSALLLSMSSGLFAQLTKGAFAITGTFGLGGGKVKTDQLNNVTGATAITTDQKTSGYAFAPAISYFVSDKIEAGIAFAIGKNTTTNTFYPTPPVNPNAQTSQKTEQPLTGVGLFGNYYLCSKENFYCYAGLQFGVGSGKGKVTTTYFSSATTIVETKNNGSTFGLNFGMLYFVKSNIALNANLGLISFNTTRWESTSPNGANQSVTTKNKTSNWVVGVNGVIISIGVKALLFNKA